MKRRMYWSLCATSIIAVLLTALLTLWSVYGVLLRQAQSDLADEYRLTAKAVEFAGDGAIDYLNTLDIRFDSMRVTLIQPDGSVLFDSDNNPGEMENHMGRPEIQDAFAKGRGEDVRRSETMGMDTYYYAQKLPDGNVLRLSKRLSSVGAVFISVVPVMAAVALLILLGCVLVSSRLTRRLLAPVEKMAENIGRVGEIERYEELEPFFQKIKEQNSLIETQMENLREERDTIRAITSNMQEGLILLDGERCILSVNRSALSLLEAPASEYQGKNLLNLSRSAELGGCVESALKGVPSDVILSKNGRDCQVFVSPVYNGGQICGAIALLLDVTERQKAERVRREFSANVSHELKTPLTSISGFAELIEKGMVADGGDIKKFAGRIYREASRLITLTDDIIRLSRIEADGEFDMEPVELRAVCENAVNALRFTADQKEIVLAATGQEVTVQGNPRMLDELVYNLTDNAIKYNLRDGRVDISVVREGNYAVLCVADTGIGIPREHQERIFERFYRVDKSRSKQTGGTGLGLSIVKHIVERHGGSLTLESAPGVGTTVTVRIPMRQT